MWEESSLVCPLPFLSTLIMDVMSGVAAAHLRQRGYKVKKTQHPKDSREIEKAWVSDSVTEQLPTLCFLLSKKNNRWFS